MYACARVCSMLDHQGYLFFAANMQLEMAGAVPGAPAAGAAPGPASGRHALVEMTRALATRLGGPQAWEPAVGCDCFYSPSATRLLLDLPELHSAAWLPLLQDAGPLPADADAAGFPSSLALPADLLVALASAGVAAGAGGAGPGLSSARSNGGGGEGDSTQTRAERERALLGAQRRLLEELRLLQARASASAVTSSEPPRAATASGAGSGVLAGVRVGDRRSGFGSAEGNDEDGGLGAALAQLGYAACVREQTFL
jgi:hypothetical protein